MKITNTNIETVCKYFFRDKNNKFYSSAFDKDSLCPPRANSEGRESYINKNNLFLSYMASIVNYPSGSRAYKLLIITTGPPNFTYISR